MSMSRFFWDRATRGKIATPKPSAIEGLEMSQRTFGRGKYPPLSKYKKSYTQPCFKLIYKSLQTIIHQPLVTNEGDWHIFIFGRSSSGIVIALECTKLAFKFSLVSTQRNDNSSGRNCCPDVCEFTKKFKILWCTPKLCHILVAVPILRSKKYIELWSF